MEDRILEILTEVCEDDIVNTERGINLFEEGLLDSLALAQLIVMLEERLGVVIAPSEIVREDIESPEKLLAFIHQRYS